MRKLLLTAFSLSLAVPALAAQQDIAQLSAVTASREALRTAVNTQLSAVQANFDEVYAVIDAGPVYVNASAPADQKVVWIDTDQSNAIKVYVGGAWTVVGSGGIGGDDLGSATYPSAAGVANWSGSAWGTSYTVGTAANNLVQLNASAQLPAVSAALLTNFPNLTVNTTGTAGGLSGTPNITVGTISAGAGGMTVDADGDAAFKSVTVTRTTSPSAIDLYEGTGGGNNKLTLTLSGNLAADATLNADQILVDGDIGSTVQAYDADLTSAAGAGAAGASKYFGTNASSVVGFYDLPSGGGTPTTITVADTTDTTAYVALFDSATGDLGPKTDTGITYNAGTGRLTATGFTGPLTGTASGNTRTIASGTVELNTTTVANSGVIASEACQALASAQTATGALSASDGVDWYFVGDPTAKTGFVPLNTGMLTLIPYVSANNAVQVKVCNNTAASITLNTSGNGATIKWMVRR